MAISTETATGLVRECKVLRTRVDAMLQCADAIDHLTREDVFGCTYRALLEDDLVSLGLAISNGERELGASVEIG